MSDSPNQPSLITTNISRKIIRVALWLLLGMFTLPAFVLMLIGGVFTFTSFQSLAYTAETEGLVTTVTKDHDPDLGTTCQLSYQFTVGGNAYTGTSDISSNTYCSKQAGSKIPVKYDPQMPSKNTHSNATPLVIGIAFLAIGLVFVVGIIVGIIMLIRSSKRDDRNNDGLFNDDMPATAAQLKLIESGMRDLGEFWKPRKMTQGEARETIDAINRKLGK